MSGRWDKERNCWYWELRHQSALLSPPLQQGGENNDDNWWIGLLPYFMEKLLSMMLWEREDCYRTGSRAIEPNLPDDHPVLLQLRLHQGDQVAQFHLITTMMMMSTMIMVRSMMMMKTSSVGKLPLPWMGTTSFISSLNRDTLKSSYVLYCCRLMLTMMKWVIMFFRIMTMIMRIKPVHMIGLRTSGPAKERECLVFYYWDKSKFTIQTNQVYKFIICMFLSNKK